MSCYRIFETRSGHAAIVWRGNAITGFRLPAQSRRDAERALFRRAADVRAAEPGAVVAAVIEDAKRYFAGEAIDFSGVAIDPGEQTALFAQIYARVRALRWGETTTYGAIAKDLGVGPEYARDVGQAMARNPLPLIIPCHRVLGAGGRIGGFSAPGGAVSKARMLALEGGRSGDADQAAFAF